MQPLFSTFQGFTFYSILFLAIVILLIICGRWIIKDFANNETPNLSPEMKSRVDKHFTSKGYLVWDIKQDEQTKKMKVSLVKNEKMIEVKGYSIPEIERYAESLV